MASSDWIVIYTDCIDFAAVKHRDQRRKDTAQTPYINHPIGVARILTAEAGITDPEVLCGAILHDTVEDTDTTLDEIEQRFGPAIRQIVAEVTDDKALPKQRRKELQIEHASQCTDKAKLVKLADKLYNLRDLQQCLPNGWTEERRQEYFRWAQKVVDQLRGVNEVLDEKLKIIFDMEIKTQ